MTAVTAAVVTPAHAALGVQHGEMWVAGLPDTCPTCGGKGKEPCFCAGYGPPCRLGARQCPTCDGTGHLSVSGPTIILSTDGHIQGTATNVTPYPIINGHDLTQDLTPALVLHDEVDLTAYGPLLSSPRSLSEWLPFGPWEPGGVALHFTGIRPEIDARLLDPTCWCRCTPDECRCIGPDPEGCGWCWAADDEDECPAIPVPCPISYPSAPVEPCITLVDLTAVP